MTHDELYERVCGPTLQEIRDGQKKILHLLQGNGEPGLYERVRSLESFKRGAIAALLFILMTLFVQGVIWLRGLLPV